MSSPAIDISKMIARRRTMPLYPFEPIEATPDYRLADFDKKIDNILAKGFPMRPNHLFALDALPWNHEERSIAYSMQAFEPLSSLLMAHSMTKRADCFAAAMVVVNDWLKQVRPPSETELAGKWKEDKKNDFLWYDMAVGLRSYRLAYIIDVLMRAVEPDEALISRLLEILDWHREILMQEEAFSSHNNHGLYQALGQLAMSRRFRDIPAMAESFAQGEQRLDAMLKQQFFDDGMHREHSPGYHWMVLGTLQEALRVGLISSDEHILFVSRAEEAMSCLVQPNLMLPAFGDTDSGSASGGLYAAKDFTHPHLRFALSQGTLGNPAPDALKIYDEAGYAIVRHHTNKAGKDGSYLAQMAAFHSPTHKHADHLTFVWHDKGEDILVDAGRYGYKGKTEQGSELWQQGFWYADPKRMYVEKTRAHNTVEIDGLDFPRRKTKPFGSALGRSTVTKNHVYAIESEARHFSTIRHARMLFICPERFLIAVDWLKDNKDAPHDFRQWFHLGSNLDLRAQDGNLTATRKGKSFASITSLMPDIALETMVRGQEEPELNGWVSHERGGALLPNWAFSFAAQKRSQATFSTLFSLQPDVQPWGENRIAASGQSGSLSWQDKSGFHKLTFARRPDEELAVNYRRRQQPDEAGS